MRMNAITAQQLTGDSGRWLEPINDALIRWEITTPDRVAMFLAQCAHESGGFKHLVENLHYSAASLLSTWPKRFTAGEAVAMAYNEELIAERAYGGRMGNGPEGSGDGFRYRGRGIIQLTGRDNYRRCGQAIGVDIETTPEAVERPKWAALSAGWFWATNGCNALADAGDYEGITRRINGGLNGWDDRLHWLEKVRGILGAPAAAQPAAPIEDRSTEYTPPAGGLPEEKSMGAFELVSLLTSVFSPLIRAKVEKAVGTEVGKPLVDNLLGMATKLTGKADPLEAVAVARQNPQVVAQLEQSATDWFAQVAPMLERLAQYDRDVWGAENEGKRTVSALAIEERKAGLWDMTKTVVWFAAGTLTALILALLSALIFQSVTGDRQIDSGLLGLAGPIFMAAVAAWGAIIAFRFDGTKDSSAQNAAMAAIASRSEPRR